MEEKQENQAKANEIARREFIQKSLLLVGGTVGASWLLSSCGKSSTPAPVATAPSVNITIDMYAIG